MMMMTTTTMNGYTNLGAMGQEKSRNRVELAVVEGLDNCDDVDGIDRAGAGAGKDGDEDVLLEAKGAGVEGEGPAEEGELEDLIGEGGGHELPHGEDDDLRGDGADVQRVLPVPEELVDESKHHAADEPQKPCSEG